MGVTVHAVKKFGALRAIDAQSEEELRAIPDGETLRLEITRPSKRSIRHHRLLFSLLHVTAEQVGWSVENLLLWSKIAAGHADIVHDRNGEVTALPRSISFAKMDQKEFNAFFDLVVTAILERLLPPGTPRNDLVSEVYERCGERIAA